MKITILVIALLFSLTLLAQKGKHDVVYLKNGSIVKGNILVLDPEKFVKLKTRDQNVWVFEMNQVDSIVRPVKVKAPAAIQTGYYNLTEFGVLAGNTNNSKSAPFTIMNVSSWQFDNGFSTGIGIGVHFFDETYLPVVADFRYFLRKHGPLPFVNLQTGYSIPLGGEYKQTTYYYDYSSFARPGIWPGPNQTELDVSARGGFLINPSIGIYSQINENFALTLSAGYSYLRHSYGKEEEYKLDVDYNRLSIKLGLQFK
ncbi:MAG TPA: hypothetical protein VN249_04450 [Prolixibacteraceae bacterium]|nr:hypothetical protein [Prolixibacteraceae bacterium]